ncbi:MAG: PQQ-dependent sugar dehydrogenase [Ilumatobacteraceae bacterium]
MARRSRSLVVRSLVAAALAAPVVGAPLGIGPSAPVVSAAPVGFVESVVGEVPAPVAVRELAPGLVAVLGKAGTVHLVRDGELLPEPALTLAGVCTESERGLLGVAAGPDLSTTGHVYLYATRREPSAPAGCVNQVSRFALGGDRIDPAARWCSSMASVRWPATTTAATWRSAKDAMLYVAVGDASATLAATPGRPVPTTRRRTCRS